MTLQLPITLIYSRTWKPTQLFTILLSVCHPQNNIREHFLSSHHTPSQKERGGSNFVFFLKLKVRSCFPAVFISPFPHIFKIIFSPYIYWYLLFKENIPCEKVPLGIYLRMGDINMVFMFFHTCRILIRSNNNDKLYYIYFYIKVNLK